MCCVTAAVTKDFGVMASDSAMYDTEKGEMSFESPKIVVFDQKKVVSFIGTHLYLANLDRAKMSMPFDALCLFLKDYFKAEKPKVEEMMKQAISDTDEQRPLFCLFLMGLHRGLPTVAQFNVFNDFEPKYLWSKGGLEFATVLYGDDTNPDKQALFKETTQYMKTTANQWFGEQDSSGGNVNNQIPKSDMKVSPGTVAEILTRGIYHKADEEMKIGLKKKYAGGAVSVMALNKVGVYPLSGFVGA